MLRQFEASLLFFLSIQTFYLFIILQQECNADTHIFVLPYLIFNFKIKTLGSVFSFECACISYITDKHFVMRIHIFCKWYIWILGRFYPDRPSDVYLEIQYLQLVQTLFAMASSKVILYGIWYFVSQNKSFPVFRSTFFIYHFLYVIINVIFESLRKIFGDAEYTYYILKKTELCWRERRIIFQLCSL